MHVYASCHNEQHTAFLQQTCITMCSSAYGLCSTVIPLASAAVLAELWQHMSFHLTGFKHTVQIQTICHNEQHTALLQETCITLCSSAYAMCSSVIPLASAAVLAELWQHMSFHLTGFKHTVQIQTICQNEQHTAFLQQTAL